MTFYPPVNVRCFSTSNTLRIIINPRKRQTVHGVKKSNKFWLRVVTKSRLDFFLFTLCISTAGQHCHGPTSPTHLQLLQVHRSHVEPFTLEQLPARSQKADVGAVCRRQVVVVLKMVLKVCTDVASLFAPPARQKPTPLLTLAPPPASKGNRGS